MNNLAADTDPWLRSEQVKQRYSATNDMWIPLRLADGSGFPKPVKFGRLNHWKQSWLDAWDAEQVAKSRQSAA